MAWIREFSGKRIDEISGREITIYNHTCSVCGWKTGHQASEFNYCPKCGTHHGEYRDGK